MPYSYNQLLGLEGDSRIPTTRKYVSDKLLNHLRTGQRANDVEDRRWFTEYMAAAYPQYSPHRIEAGMDNADVEAFIIINDANARNRQEIEQYITEDYTDFGEGAKETAFLLDSFKSAREVGLSSPSLQDYQANLSSTFKAKLKTIVPYKNNPFRVENQ